MILAYVNVDIGHPQVSTKTVTSVDDLSLCQRWHSTHLRMAHRGRNMLWEEYNKKIQQLWVQEKHILFTFIYID
jgi:hypothetical protein